MDQTGRKRSPLGPLSPSSSNHGRKRGTNSSQHTTKNGANDSQVQNTENQHPNIQVLQSVSRSIEGLRCRQGLLTQSEKSRQPTCTSGSAHIQCTPGSGLSYQKATTGVSEAEFSSVTLTHSNLIGALENYESLHDIDTVNGKRRVVRFKMTDGRHSCNITAWEEVGVKVEEEKSKATEEPIIVIITGTKLNVFRKTAQASTTHNSKVYMNLDIDSVIAMRQRLCEEGYIATDEQREKPKQKPVTQVIQTMTLKQLSEIETKDYIKKHVYCNIKIVSVEDNSNWWYDSCGGCETEVETLNGKIYCSGCQKNIPVAEKRYRIVVLGEDSTEACNFVMMDRSVKRMVGTTATKLISEKIKNNTKNVLPSQIKALSGRELKLKLLINEDNVVAKSRLFYVVDACDTNVSTISSSSDTNCTSSEAGGSSAIQFCSNSDTPGTQKSATKRVKVEP